MRKGIGPRALGSPLKQTAKPKRKNKMDNVVLSPQQQARQDYTDRRRKMNPVEVAKEITPGVNALFRVADVAERLKDLPEKVSKNKKTNK